MIALGLSNRRLRVLDCATKDVLFEDTEAHEDFIGCVSFSPNGSSSRQDLGTTRFVFGTLEHGQEWVNV